VKKIFIYTLLNLTLVNLLQVTELYAQVHPLEKLVPDGLINLGKGPFYSNHVFVVDKSKRTLIVWEQSEKGYSKMKEINADFGKASGNKVSNGDQRTPEGIYFFSNYLEKAKLDFRRYGIHDVKAFPMDYPNLFDRREGKTGSGIWLHTLPDDTPLSRGSRGCVVIRNNDFDEAMALIKLNNTPIIVQDEINYVPPEQIETQRTLMVTWLKKWLEAWQSKNLDSYMSYFDKSFHSKKMNYDQWRKYKSNLADTYGDINISISEPRIVHFRDEWIVQFIQKYKSDKYEDFGHKTLYIRGTTIDNLKIIAEDFDVTTSEIAIAQYDAANFNCCSTDDKKLTTKN
jgi:murein L,D-transpeptidase YafK